MASLSGWRWGIESERNRGRRFILDAVLLVRTRIELLWPQFTTLQCDDVAPRTSPHWISLQEWLA